MLLRASALSLVAVLAAGWIEAPALAAPCSTPSGTAIWWSPENPTAGDRLRLLAIRETAGEAQLAWAAGKGKARALATVTRGGPPFSFAGEIARAAAGPQRIELRKGNKVLACRMIKVLPRGARRPVRRPSDVFWKSERAWDASTEDLYSAWVEMLFDAPPEESLSFRPLEPALRDADRNFLYNHLSLREDDPKNRDALPAAPDCADLPYFLRSYFAWKLGLPAGFRECNRGTSKSPPQCTAELFTNHSPASGKTVMRNARTFFRKLANVAHSGSLRTALEAGKADHYPIAVTRETLRPGMVYADPYGHVLVLSKWVPQTSAAGGLLLAVDGQPDGSIGRKRFWEGNFLYAQNEPSAGPGWKAPRPLVVAADGTVAPMSNQDLAKKGHVFPTFSLEQDKLSAEAFYARMSKLINPRGLAPQAAYEETLAALVEQIETRVGSVDNGEKYMKETGNAVVEMPEGPKIFETIGPWEDYATPSRDMRLIIAMNVLLDLPARIERRPELFVLGGRKPAEVRKEIEAQHARLTKERSIEYTRSDGATQGITVADVLARKTNLEMAYNPNDCVEIRWGAPEGSAERKTCKRRAPEVQLARMQQYRAWFREARRPPR